MNTSIKLSEVKTHKDGSNEKGTNKFVFTEQEVADILANYIEHNQIQGHVLISNPRLVIGRHDIVLESDIIL